jgi:estrogen-related receptor beta like 1
MAEEQPLTQAPAFVPLSLGLPVTIDDGTMEDLVDRLKLLNYEQDFCIGFGKGSQFKPLTRTYFALPSDNPNAQFFYFTSLAAWLMSLCGRQMQAPGQFEDPNTSATNILYEMKQLDLSVKDLAPNRLRTGNGESVLQVLGMLVDKAQMCKGFQYRPVDGPTETVSAVLEEEIEGDPNPSGDPDRQEKAGPGGITDYIDDAGDTESEEEFFDPKLASKGGAQNTAAEDRELIEPSVAADVWMVEVERLGPQMRFPPQEDAKDWRMHLEATTLLLQSVEKSLPEANTVLMRHTEEIQKAIEKVSKREQSLSSQFHEMVDKYRLQLKDHESVQKECTRVNESVTNASSELNKLSEELDRVKGEIQQREDRMSDTSPLMQIKEAVAKMRTEIKEMSLRIGVLQHTVLHYTLRQGKAKGNIKSTSHHLDRSMEIE